MPCAFVSVKSSTARPSGNWPNGARETPALCMLHSDRKMSALTARASMPRRLRGHGGRATAATGHFRRRGARQYDRYECPEVDESRWRERGPTLRRWRSEAEHNGSPDIHEIATPQPDNP